MTKVLMVTCGRMQIEQNSYRRHRMIQVEETVSEVC